MTDMKVLRMENKKEEVKLLLRSSVWSQGQMTALLTLTDKEVYAIFSVISLLTIYYLSETPHLWKMRD